MSDAAAKSRSRKRRAVEEGGGESPHTDVEAPMAAAAAAAAAGSLGPAAEAAAAATLHAASPVKAKPMIAAAGSEVQPLPEQMRKKQRRSSPLSSPIDQLATVEQQLVMQFLDSKSKLKAARCNRRLLQATDHPFAWQGPSVSVTESAYGRPHVQLDSLIRQSLLRHASIALEMNSDLPAAEVAAIPRLRGLSIYYRVSDDLAPQLLPLPSLQGLQTLRVSNPMNLSTLQLLPTLPALHTLECWLPDDSVDWSWLPAMHALTTLDLTITCNIFPQPLIDCIGRCTRLQSLGMRFPIFEAGAFARFCSTPSMRRLRHLELQSFNAQLTADEYRAAFSALAQLESLRLQLVFGVDRLLPHLAHAPTLRSLAITCGAQCPTTVERYGSVVPSREVLRQLLTAAPRLEVRLAVGRRYSCSYRTNSASLREQLDDQWHELQRVGAEMARVTVVNE